MLKREIVLGNRLLSDFIVDSVSVSSSVSDSASIVDSMSLGAGVVNDYDFVMLKCVVDEAWKPDLLDDVASVVEYNGWKPVVNAGFVSSLSGGSDVSVFSGQLCCAVCGVPLMDLAWTSDDAVGLKPTCYRCLGKTVSLNVCFVCGKVLSGVEFDMNYQGGYLAVDYRCFACVVSVPRVRNVLHFSQLLADDGHVCMRCHSSPAFFKQGSGYFCWDCFHVLRDVAVMDDCVFVECWLG